MEERLEEMISVHNISSEFLLYYYLLEDTEKNYGVKIEKKEKRAGALVLCEDYNSGYTIENEDTANDVLELLAKNMVTPATADCVLEDLGYFEKRNRK